MSSIAAGLAHLNGWLAYLVIAALVFGETAVFLGFVLPGEAAVVLGGVLASRGHVSIVPLVTVVVIGAIVGPIVGYEIGRRMGDRLFAARVLRRIPGGVDARQVHAAGQRRPRCPDRPLRRHPARTRPGRRGRGAGAVPDLLLLQRDRRDHLGRRLLPARVPGRVRLRRRREAGRHRPRRRDRGACPRRRWHLGGAQAPRGRCRRGGRAAATAAGGTAAGGTAAGGAAAGGTAAGGTAAGGADGGGERWRSERRCR